MKAPWHVGDAWSLGVLNAAGLVLILAGWYVAAGQLQFTHQTTGANIAIAGVVFAGVGDGLWLLTGRRALGKKRRTLTAAVERRPWKLRTVEVAPRLAAAKGMTHYHRADCAFVAGRRVYARKRETHERQGRRPCAVCRP